MPFRNALIAALFLGLLLAASAGAGELLRRRAAVGQQKTAADYYRESWPGPGAAPYPAQVPGPRPWYGQALGAPTFSYGFFGAKQHYQHSVGTSYYGDYHDYRWTRGY